jgi:hypothetical protein
MVFEGKIQHDGNRSWNGCFLDALQSKITTKISEFQKENRTQTENELTGSGHYGFGWVAFSKKGTSLAYSAEMNEDDFIFNSSKNDCKDVIFLILNGFFFFY